jgi:transcriptional regulator with XRE-family HTH domain
LDWTQEDLANAADVGAATVRDYENERRGNVVGSLREIEDALKNGGVTFIHADESGGAGVRLLGELPDVLRWPTKRGDEGELVIRIDHRGVRYEIFLSDTTIEDLAELGHTPKEATYLKLIEKWKASILRAAAKKIDSKQATPDRRVHLSDSEIRDV